MWDIWVIMTVRSLLERMFVSTSGLTSLAALSTVWGAFQKAQIDHRSKASNIAVMIKLAPANPGKYLPNISWLPEKLSMVWTVIKTSLVVFSDAGKPQVNSWSIVGLFVIKRTCLPRRWHILIKKISKNQLYQGSRDKDSQQRVQCYWMMVSYSKWGCIPFLTHFQGQSSPSYYWAGRQVACGR